MIKNKLVRTAITYGVLAALACSFYLLVLYIFGANSFGRYKQMYFGIYAVFFMLGMQHYRDKINNLKITAQQALGLGFILNFVAVLSYGILVSTTLTFVDTENLALKRHQSQLEELLDSTRKTLLEHQDEVLEETGKTISQLEKEYEENIIAIGKITNWDLTQDLLIGLIASGIFFTFLFMLIFKT